MASGRTFRPGPRAEWKQNPHRFTDDSLSTTEIASPLDVAYAPGGTRWRQTNRAATINRPPLHANYRQRPQRFTDDTLSTTEIASPLDVAYGPGGTRWRQIVLGVRVRPWPHSQARIQNDVDFPLAGVDGTIAVTQDDDTTAITGTFTDPPYGDGGIRARANSTAYRRQWSHEQYIRHQFDTDIIPGIPDVTGTVTATQDDDVAAITGTFTDPTYGDGGIRSRVQQVAYRRPGAEAYYQHRTFPPPPETYTATIAVTQDDDTAAITGQVDDPYTGASQPLARAQTATKRRLASRLPFIRRVFNLPQDTTVVGTVAVTQDDDTAAIIGTFTDPDYLGDGGVRARAQSATRRRLLSRIPFLRRSASAPAPDPVTGTIGVTQDDDTASIAGTFSDPLPPWDGGIRHRQIAGRRPRRPVYCQRRYTIDVGTAVPDLPPLVPPFAAFLDAYQATTAGATRATTVMGQTVTSTVGTTPRATTRNTTPQGETE